MLHTQLSSLQHRVSAPALPRDLNTHAAQQQQQQYGGEGLTSSSSNSSPAKALQGSSKGGSRFKRRGVVVDVCWMLRIRTFQVGLMCAFVCRVGVVK